MNNYNIPGYNAFSKGYSISSAGGLVTYISDHLEVEQVEFDTTITLWESLFLKIRDKSRKTVFNVGNIYTNTNHPRKYSDLNFFIQEISAICSQGLRKINCYVKINYFE